MATWALGHRKQGRTILFVHHSGKNGAQRGTSKREDILDSVLALKRPADYSPVEGASFEVHFEKHRNDKGDSAKPFEARLGDVNGAPAWTVGDLEEWKRREGACSERARHECARDRHGAWSPPLYRLPAPQGGREMSHRQRLVACRVP